MSNSSDPSAKVIPVLVDRRRFFSTMAGAGAALMLEPMSARAADEVDPRVAEIVASTLGIDTHNHVDVPLAAGDVPGAKIDLSGELKRSGLSAICMTFAVDYQPITKPGEAYERFKNGLDSMDRQLELNGMKRSLDLAELRAAHEKGQPTVIQSIEGCHFLEGHAERVQEAYQRGLRHLGLLHDSDASVPLGDVYTNPPRFGGLTEFGVAVVKECNRLGILIDLAHANADTVAGALKASARPMMISHTGPDWMIDPNQSFAKMMRPRLISKEQAKVVADAGGVIGVWGHLSDNPLEYARNLRALVDVVGIDHVCIGTDTKMTPGINLRGERGPKDGSPRPRAGERTNEAWAGQTLGFYHAVVAAMLEAGFTPEEIGKIGGGNFCRVFDAATAGHA